MNKATKQFDGTSFGLSPIHHRWDTLNRTRVITFFNRQQVLAVVSEVDHLVEAYRSAWNASVKDRQPILESVKWVGKWGSFLESYQPAPVDTYTQARWDALPVDVRESAEAQRIIVAARELVQTVSDGTMGLPIDTKVEARLQRHSIQPSGLMRRDS